MFEGYVGQMYLTLFVIVGLIIGAIVGISYWFGKRTKK